MPMQKKVPSRQPAARAQKHPKPSAPAAKTGVSSARLGCDVIYVPGIGCESGIAELKRNWDTALFGQSMVDTEMVDWLYGLNPRSSRLPKSFVEALQDSLGIGEADLPRDQKLSSRLPGVGDALYGWLTRAFIRNAGAHLFDAVQRRGKRLKAALEQRSHCPTVIVAHSLGSIVAYHVLHRLSSSESGGRSPDVALLVTLGSVARAWPRSTCRVWSRRFSRCG